MNHKELHKILSEDLKALRDGSLEPKKLEKYLMELVKLLIIVETNYSQLVWV